ncbi:hypothetical protein [Allorhizobium taibaishanense]|uniref:Uncharacterized protein n=1 Tax=Allorhizobium taibaishanense TaxID=887144 RepID=A0A7W6HLY2_9HYPH|nr:hypothetical protein [Allorhizobium taibaishanense]MBB4007541.1 hypothetical protein [Allorhizobium taibaishanense]
MTAPLLPLAGSLRIALEFSVFGKAGDYFPLTNFRKGRYDPSDVA